MESRRKRSHRLFRKLFPVSNGIEFVIDAIMIDKMMFHILECLGALHEIRNQRVKEGKISVVEDDRARVFYAAISFIGRITQTDCDDHAFSILFSAFPDKDKLTDDRNWLTLHWSTISDNVSPDLALRIFRQDVAAIQRCHNPKSSSNTTPIHLLAASLNPNIKMLCGLVESFSQTPFLLDADSDLPLHYAAMYANDSAVVEVLMDLNPEAVTAKGFGGDMTPLHCAIYHNKSSARDEIVKSILHRDEDRLMVLVDGDLDTPLHKAAAQDSIDIVKTMLEVNLEVAQWPNARGRLPLHISCAYNTDASADMFKVLLEAYPAAISIPDSDGLLVAHIAAQFSNVETMTAVLAAFPEAVGVNVGKFGTPLHRAVLSNNMPMIEFVYAQYPDAGEIKDANGLIPFDYAMYLGNFDTLKAAL